MQSKIVLFLKPQIFLNASEGLQVFSQDFLLKILYKFRQKNILLFTKTCVKPNSSIWSTSSTFAFISNAGKSLEIYS
jgi:hypothetical protein